MFRLIFKIIEEILLVPIRLFSWAIDIIGTIIEFPFRLAYTIIINIDNFLLIIIKSPFIIMSYIRRVFSKNDDDIIEYKSKNERYISQKIKDQVWRRDRGECVKCGSNEMLEYDHIIPVVLGGKSTYRNLQLLCESCNRSKGAKID